MPQWELRLRWPIATEATRSTWQRRFDQEQAARFLRRKLFVARFQTLETRGEWSLVGRVLLANPMICAARHMVSSVRRPWQPKVKARADLPLQPGPRLSPSLVQRGIARVFTEFGAPARAAKPRGKPQGWSSGTPRSPRRSLPLVKRGPPDQRKLAEAA